ncbi:uncharacterized protein UBRO2_00685 [Ustilago bromivora]|uniref:Uncharacterized protein n=1 Tax=Ustilago bromivora TaxID=307758 RepID=A0A8H8QIQ8_9BASI|nr:uncharacterized protein UBRO2_00685 [Ustilago bromivora]
MARNQRVAVLYWLQNVGKDTTQTDLAESTTLYGSPLPLTTRLLADHCSTFEGGLYSTQAHLDAAGYSSLSDFFNSTKKAELCGLLHPSKRAKASNNSTATSYTLTPRKTKMTKRELRLEQHRSASPEEVVTSIDPSEGLGPYPEYQAHCATASRNADKRSTSESAHVIDGVSHEVSCIRTDVSRAYVPTQSCASNERIAEIKGDEDALTKVLNTLRSQRLSTPVIVQSNQRFIGEATPAKLGPEAEAVAYPDNDVRDPEESEDTIRLISPKKRVEPSHEASSRRILELAARLNA